MSGLLGRKLGMTHKFNEDGRFVPVTVIEAGPCFVIQKKANSIQVGFGKIADRRLARPQSGVFKKISVEPQAFIKEIKVDKPQEYNIGQAIKVDIFKEGDFVDVTGVSIGKGFQGGVKRWHWSGGPKSHGSMSHRRVGSIGASSDPSRVFKNTHMPGHMGNSRITVQNLRVVSVDSENNMLSVKGSVAGHKNSYVIIRKAKKRGDINALKAEAAAREAEKKQSKPKGKKNIKKK
ncbi:MAG: 50S ribosomal protein L3 [Candidatus Omnitrophica bacterium CG11_big_fil_rev_8_21_14_0_20_42_13]|uniref:Large ribosomal subunit protein uL3 n=1 Tax=Candidatus Ghiorseimicrobium undicola TaxID=1974746 RepID=A0A2H0LVG1_9BACT|nr:MAG: 50S ribosomal protein L3 [Candidatus Omnitrophica bacterium CG11_big_fil_rev_8_21_14_0_20_42_13]